MTADVPDLPELRQWVGVAEEFLPDADLQRMLDGAVEVIAKTCRVPVTETGDPALTGWPSALVSAVLRRVQREIATKNLPLGFVDTAGEYGPARIPNYDVQIEELEGRYRRVVV